MKLLNIVVIERAAQHVALQLIDLGMDRFAHRLVVFNHEIEEGIEDKIFPVL
ncbi:hypothetical protein D3C85_1789790 [compost metagenome]